MNHETCEIVQDLLPLYIDKTLSDASNALVTEHLRYCGECRALRTAMEQNIPVPKSDISAPVRQLKKRNHRALLSVFLITCLFFSGVMLFLLSPLLRGWQTPDEKDLAVSEAEDGSVSLAVSSRVNTLYYLYKTEDDGTLTLYLTFGDTKEQYAQQLLALLKKRETLDFTFEAYTLKVTDNSCSITGGPSPTGGFLSFYQADTISLPENVKKIYYFEDDTGEIWAGYRDFLKGKMEQWQNSDALEEGTYVIPTDGYDFEGNIRNMQDFFERRALSRR